MFYRYIMTFALLICLSFPATAFGFGGGSFGGGSGKRGPRKLTKKQKRTLLRLGHARLVKQIRKAKRGRTIRALMAKARKIISEGRRAAPAKDQRQVNAEKKRALIKRLKELRNALITTKRRKSRRRIGRAISSVEAQLIRLGETKTVIRIRNQAERKRRALHAEAKHNQAKKAKRANLQKKRALIKRLKDLRRALITTKRRKSRRRIGRAIGSVEAQLIRLGEAKTVIRIRKKTERERRALKRQSDAKLKVSLTKRLRKLKHLLPRIRSRRNRRRTARAIRSIEARLRTLRSSAGGEW